MLRSLVGSEMCIRDRGGCFSEEGFSLKDYDYDKEKADQDEKAREAEERKLKQEMQRELAAIKREEMRDSAFEIKLTIHRTDTGEKFEMKTFGYETVAVLKNRIEERLHRTPILYEPQLEYQGKTLPDGMTFKELQVRDRSTLKLHIHEIGGSGRNKPNRRR
eukprot:TRINITY_DN11683_c0_g1_i2.p1 TRINITY_DN11683_c0_g1~~TRINITY_DN11683_c0_g1_i2.p1  ORF type:complete len:162 (+),score=61.47 TRINITY_DN11683_c0_g1_i2:155-640(+)